MTPEEKYMALLAKRTALVNSYQEHLLLYSQPAQYDVWVDRTGHITDVVSNAIIFREQLDEQLALIDLELDILEAMIS